VTEHEMKIDGLLSACDKRQLAVMLIEARTDAEMYRVQRDEARRELQRIQMGCDGCDD